MSSPLLSIGIPLYRAANFYDTIVANIDGIDYPNVEIIVSDRHGLDDTIDRLEERYRDDDRITTHRHHDQLGWWHNYNFVLSQASGKYFRWLPQDDRLPRQGLDKLVERLERNPGAILVYCATQNVDVEGRVVSTGRHDLRYAAKRHGRWGYRDALGVAAHVHHLGAGAGIFRRIRIVASGLEIRPVPGGLGGTWAFWYALACRGRFEMVTDVVAYKAWHPGNYTSSTRRSWRNNWGYYRVVRSFDNPGGSRIARIGRDVALLAATVVVRPAVPLVWSWTPRGRRSRQYRLP